MTNGNESAYPVVVGAGDYTNGSGLTKREYFTGIAMQGFISAGYSHTYNDDEIAKFSSEMADALINQLNKKEE